MRTSVRRIVAIAVALVGAGLTALTGCGTKTSVTQLWSAPIPRPPMRKVLIMGIHMDEANRRALEDSFAAELAARGVDGIPSYKVFGDQGPDQAKAQATVQSMQADGILTANYKGVHEKLTFVPGAYGPGAWAGAYGWGGGGYYDSYVYADQIVNLETTLWDRTGQQVVWAALTNTTNPSSGRDFVGSVTKKVIPQLAESGFIPKKD